MTDPGTSTLPWRFDDLRALFVNCTLKRSPEVSHTQGPAGRGPGPALRLTAHGRQQSHSA
jgi:hypothetical protein